MDCKKNCPECPETNADYLMHSYTDNENILRENQWKM